LERMRAERLNPAVVSFEEDLVARPGERNHYLGAS
jgi:ketol-acid reductoisomerase